MKVESWLVPHRSSEKPVCSQFYAPIPKFKLQHKLSTTKWKEECGENDRCSARIDHGESNVHVE